MAVFREDQWILREYLVPGLQHLPSRFKLVALSNGERDFLSHVVKQRIQYDFDGVISVQDVGVSKPNSQVYR